MEIKKAILTAAGRNQHTLPLQTLVDRDGRQKSALAILIEEVVQAGVEQIGVVIAPGDQAAFTQAAGPHASRLRFVEQTEPLGYGHAVWCARAFAEREPFLLLVGDHLFLSRGPKSCAQQLLELARAEACAVSAVQATHESKLPYYGAIGGRLMPGHPRVYLVESVVEKPSPTQAEQELIVPGLRAGYYLCFFGLHALGPTVMDLLDNLLASAPKGRRLTLSDALAPLAGQERYLAVELQGRRYDIGQKYGLLTAQLALALEGQDQQEVLSQLVELLALRAS